MFTDQVGEKGIGRLSFFNIARTITYFSAGYHFSLHDTPQDESKISYIVPQIVDQIPACVLPYLNGNTIILLDLKPKFTSSTRNLEKCLSPLRNFDVTQVLFLKKLEYFDILGRTCEKRRENGCIILRKIVRSPLFIVLI